MYTVDGYVPYLFFSRGVIEDVINPPGFRKNDGKAYRVAKRKNPYTKL